MRPNLRARLASWLRHFLDVPAQSEVAAVRLDVAELAAIECMRSRELELLHEDPLDYKALDVIREEKREMQIGYGRRRGGRA